MNWPNRLSIIRVLCIPVLILLLSLEPVWCHWAAVLVFSFASFTDYLDGHLARKHQWITVFGKFIDPVADKLLVLSTFIQLIGMNLVPSWMVVLILARELSVDGLRLIAISKGQVIAAGHLGKIKTASQMFFLLMLLILRMPAFSFPVGIIFSLWIIVITLWSGVDYFIRNRRILSE